MLGILANITELFLFMFKELKYYLRMFTHLHSFCDSQASADKQKGTHLNAMQICRTYWSEFVNSKHSSSSSSRLDPPLEILENYEDIMVCHGLLFLHILGNFLGNYYLTSHVLT